MENYRAYISPRRQSLPTPKNLVTDGRAAFGTFDKEFAAMDLKNCVTPVHRYFPKTFNRFRLTLWEACEINLDQGVLLAAVTDMGVFGMVLHVFFDKRSKQVYSWKSLLKRASTAIAPNLLNGSVSTAQSKKSRIRFVNHFEEGRCLVEGAHSADGLALEYSFELERISLPSVVCIPLGPNRPLYSQKDMFRVKGSLSINDEAFTVSEQTVAVVDDHKGYYPYKTHYDWVSTMGWRNGYFGLNLTRNQSTKQEDYNENLIWLERTSSLLPPVTFKHSKDGKIWQVDDEHDMVKLTFTRANQFHMAVNAGFIKIDYAIAFGELSGYVRDLDGKKHVLDGMMGIGEDKTLRF